MREVFADTNYWVAVSYPRDQFHAAALSAKGSLGEAILVTTDEVLVEFLNLMSKLTLRDRAASIVRAVFDDANIVVLQQTRTGFLAGLEFYERRQDKEYSLTDCISMNAMDDRGIRDVLTNDHHFEQEGHTVLISRQNA
jgi:predicted nucleic acid-binding protein